MIQYLLYIFHKIVVKSELAALRRKVQRLRYSGHSISSKAHLDRRTELHIADSGRLTIADGVSILNDTWLITHPNNTMVLGENVFISQHCTISGNVTIGENSLIAGFVTIIDANHVAERSDMPISAQGATSSPIIIGRDVWIGAHSVILQGVSIGDHCIVGANSTVTSDLPPWSVAAGSPAKVIKERPH